MPAEDRGEEFRKPLQTRGVFDPTINHRRNLRSPMIVFPAESYITAREIDCERGNLMVLECLEEFYVFRGGERGRVYFEGTWESGFLITALTTGRYPNNEQPYSQEIRKKESICGAKIFLPSDRDHFQSVFKLMRQQKFSLF
ncbi:hypothetical protein TSAR_004371 [Trichomalopsis sarcophagae]|uniref:Uncharacterized protein n=1 Tax=Trichomalopsis sarcophagae TaxID=543379 RepID=A0A232ESP5_9HYME|nr:hypothetical protein TSAR_004371 [Trichomalopsis sarcophagae]